VDLHEAVAGNLPSRAALAAALIEALLKLLENYGGTGFLPYHGEFMEADFLKGQVVELEDSKGPVFGRAVRVESDGFLLLETACGMHRVSTGDVSVKNLL
jgi:biotin-(acetyl-CoA carboxylase) ligase